MDQFFGRWYSLDWRKRQVQFAAERGDLWTIRWLMKDDIFPSRPLIRACAYGHEHIVRHFLNHPLFDPNAKSGWIFRAAVRHNQHQIIKILFPLVDPNEAIQDSGPEMMKLLLTHPKIDTQRLLRWAIRNEYLDVVALTLPRANPTEELFHVAIEKNNVELVRLLMADPRVDPNSRSKNALYHALRYCHHDLARLLLTRIDPPWYCLRVASIFMYPDIINHPQFDQMQIVYNSRLIRHLTVANFKKYVTQHGFLPDLYYLTPDQVMCILPRLAISDVYSIKHDPELYRRCLVNPKILQACINQSWPGAEAIITFLDSIHPQWDLWLEKSVLCPDSLVGKCWSKMMTQKLLSIDFLTL